MLYQPSRSIVKPDISQPTGTVGITVTIKYEKSKADIL
ncbi:hypothetical protein SAMN06269250_5049 [Spirosoma fluviale]|uniref:Uncharacterized protein n=1 Tax=Spirosoma fluviale TaxID=1597977 RepID=A0A286GK59_9BACT|nr:hypothetical protein SAMN06269250_5049 [Spirosoma fluviale]